MIDDEYLQLHHQYPVYQCDHVHDPVPGHDHVRCHFAMMYSMETDYGYQCHQLLDGTEEDRLPKMHQADDDALVAVECPGVADAKVDGLPMTVVTVVLN